MSEYDIIIVGCGVFGLSSALQFAKKGLKVLSLDAYPVPSELSAANDFNKIIRIEYSDDITAKLAVEALNYWENDPLYTKNYAKTGRLTLTPSDPNSARSKYEAKSLEILKKLGVNQRIEKVTNPQTLAAKVPQFKDNTLPEKFTSTLNYDCGTGYSGKALVSVYEKAKIHGAQFVFGVDGFVTKIESYKVTVKSGLQYKAKKILVTAGAYTGLLVPLDSQTKVFGTFVTHIQLTPEEYEKYKDMPIFFSAQHGYFFPPDEDLHQIKIGVTTCDAYSEIDHPFEKGKKLRAPRYTIYHPQETLPAQHRDDIKKLFNLIVPELANHELVDSKTCWIADSVDSYFLIDESPYHKDVFIGTGDSSHSFKFLPTIGKYIDQRIFGNLDPDLKKKWSWKNHPSFEKGENAKSRFPRKHYDLENTKFYKAKL